MKMLDEKIYFHTLTSEFYLRIWQKRFQKT